MLSISLPMEILKNDYRITKSIIHYILFTQSHIPHTLVYLQHHVIEHLATFAGRSASKNFVISSNTRKELERRPER